MLELPYIVEFCLNTTLTFPHHKVNQLSTTFNTSYCVIQ